MPKAPIAKLRKKDIETLANWKCPLQGHSSHNGLEHYNCWLKYGKITNRVGYLDIETSNLDADFGIMFSYCIKTEGKNEYIGRSVSGKEVIKDLDKRLVKDCIRDLQQYDTLVTYYGSRFDLPYIRSRALYHRLPFIFYGQIKHIDAYYIARSKLKIHSRRLASVCNLLGIEGKTHIKALHWIKALQGCDKSLNYIFDHNKKDVFILEKAYNVLKDYFKETRRSI